ncbi:hypothetical protein KP806_14980 [Paenibacillus sp. N4]|uniref:hypothetical protein n=1 Tax=Paenibacillus vietnamensis TaxID=2590547 RepID=UPI001CD0B7F2|nr:hypothetical protein [Paenibacillus vietnamensis]MCA0756356.1 hypothetical protein [Paenibacillus vietnamensis]
MLKSKIIISSAVFLLLLAAGGGWSIHLSKQRSLASYSTPYPNTFTIYSTRYLMSSADRTYPFSPREYVRIIHRVEDRSESVTPQ